MGRFIDGIRNKTSLSFFGWPVEHCGTCIDKRTKNHGKIVN
jgi:hypothetical protein